MDRVTAESSMLAPAAPLHCRTGDVAWEVSAAWGDLLQSAAADGLPIERWLREGRAAAVKQGVGRTIYRVDLPHRSFFVKHLRSGGLVQAVKHWFRSGACRREYEKARELARRGIPAVAPVALGERRRGARLLDSYLITEAVPQACSLDEFLARHEAQVPPGERFRLRQRLLAATARLCARAHDAGVFHDDLHGGNILVRLDTCLAAAAPAAEAGPQLLFVDLPGVQLSGPLDAARTRDSLAMLCAGFWRRMSESDRLRFWRAYLAERRELPFFDVASAAREIRAAALSHARRIAGRRDKRAWADNRDFYRLRSVAGTAHAVRDLPRTMVEQLLRDPEALWQANVDRPVKLSFGSLTVEAELPTVGEPRRVAVKRLRPKTWWKALVGLLRNGRAPEAWYRGHALLARGIPTARPLVVYEPRQSHRGAGFLITEWLDGALDVHLYAWDLARRTEAQRRRRTRQSAEALGRVVGYLHDQGFTHRDLKANNLLIRERPDGVEAFLIDLDGLRQRGRPDRAACTKNLTRLALSAEMHPWLSRTDRLRFLRAYLRRYDPNQRDQWKTWWRETARHVTAALAEIRKAGKPVT